jgi:hypothetical protein
VRVSEKRSGVSSKCANLGRMSRPFNQGGIPTIACFNQAETPLGFKLAEFVRALQEYVDRHVAPVWGTPAKVIHARGFKKKAWALVFLDDADRAKPIALHDLTPGGMPLAKVFVRSVLKAGEQITVAASHELVEMLVDPGVNLMTTGPDADAVYAYESADPVEDLSFKVRGFEMSNFVYPAYFEAFHKQGSVQFDRMKQVRRPFQILPGGYQVIFKNGEWSQLYGSHRKRKHFANEDRRGHRSDTRKKAKRIATSR